MEYSFKDVLTWAFTHPEIKSSINNYIYLCQTQFGAISKSNNGDFIEAINILQEAASIGNPGVCLGLFDNASIYFMNARKLQRDEPKLLSYIGQMLCNHWAGKRYLNTQLQQEISAMKYEGSFWEKHGNSIINLGSAALAGVGMLFGAPPSTAVGSSLKGARGLTDSHSDETKASEKCFNNARNAVLSLRF